MQQVSGRFDDNTRLSINKLCPSRRNLSQTGVLGGLSNARMTAVSKNLERHAKGSHQVSPHHVRCTAGFQGIVEKRGVRWHLCKKLRPPNAHAISLHEPFVTLSFSVGDLTSASPQITRATTAECSHRSKITSAVHASHPRGKQTPEIYNTIYKNASALPKKVTHEPPASLSLSRSPR